MVYSNNNKNIFFLNSFDNCFFTFSKHLTFFSTLITDISNLLIYAFNVNIFYYFTESGRGLMTEEAIMPKDVIISIPQNLLITPKSILDSHLGNFLNRYLFINSR